MDRKFRIRTNILICVIILVGFAAVTITSYNAYSHIINDDIVNISKLTSTSIYSDIRNELTKPIFVSLTMANDSFLKTWMTKERSAHSAPHQEDLRQYLLGIKNKYNYDSVFLVSDASMNYYHYNGINKVLSEDNAHDVWYSSFLNKNVAYDLDVDTDEANHNRLSVFVNCRMTDQYGNLMGVTGVGLELDQVQSLLKSFENDYGLDALLFSENGTVQADTHSSLIENKNVFDIPILSDNRNDITANRSTTEVFPFKEQPFDGYYITRYIEDLNWFLLVKKDTSVLENSMYAQTARDLVIYVLVAVCVLIIANGIIKKNDKLMMNMTKTDQLTGLPNRRGFNESLKKAISEVSFYVFVFDIDNFKAINDTHGHLIGDSVLRIIGQIASDVFGTKGMVCRWGGDEFAGYYTAEKHEMTAALERFFKSVREEPSFSLYKTTVSMGVTCGHKIDNAHTLIYRADQALYEAKGSGKDRYCIIEAPDRKKCSKPCAEPESGMSS